jgi:hypothetical protein
VSCFHLSIGAFGNRNGSRVLDLVDWIKGAPLVWSELAKGFCTGALGRAVNFQVVASGSQQLISQKLKGWKGHRQFMSNF